MATRVALAGLLCAVLLGLSAGCGDGEGGGGSLPTLLPSTSPTRSLPAPTRSPTRTEEPTDEPTDGATEEPTREPSDEPTREPSDRPTQRPTEEPTEESTAAPTESESAGAADQEDSAQDDSDEEGVPSWVWWLLAAVVLATGALTWFLVARSARRRAWQEQLRAAEGEVAWLARELLPQLRDTGSLEQIAGGWQVALPRVAEAEDQLTVLESSARNVTDGGRAGLLRNAVRDARARVEAAISGVRRETWPSDLDDAITLLESALAPDPGGQT